MMMNVLGMCYILCMCVCVGASDTTIASDTPGTFLGGSQGGAGMPPLVTQSVWHRAVARCRRGSGQCPEYAQRSAPGDSPGQRPEIFFLGGFCYF
jgi:hypothetical protein